MRFPFAFAVLVAMAVAVPAVAQVEDVPAVPDVVEDAVPATVPMVAALPLPPVPAPIAAPSAVGAPTDGQAVAAVGQVREAVHARDWGLLVGAVALLLLWVVTRFVVPAAHGGIGWKIAAYAATLAGYCATNIASGMEVADIAWTVGLGALLAAVAVFAPPAKPLEPGGRVEVRIRPPASAGCARPGMIAMLLVFGAALVLLGVSACNVVTPGIVKGADYVTKDALKYAAAAVDPLAKKEKTEIACTLRCLVDLPAIPECPPCQAVK